jgi:DNA-binding FadR family transcriptional regulator
VTTSSDGDDPNDVIPVNRIVPAYQQVADTLRAQIVDNRLAPGERIPGELELSEMFGVSRGTIREALRALASENLIRTARGVTGGTFVSYPRPDQVSEYLKNSLNLLSNIDEVTVDELTEARRLLEGPAAGMAAARGSEAQIAAIRGSVPTNEADVRPEFEGNRTFHQLILEASGNRLLELMTEPIFLVLRDRFTRQNADPIFWRNVRTDHEEIADAIAAGDEAAAERAMVEHLDRLASTYRKIDRTLRT